MSEATTSLSPAGFGRELPPTGLFGRVGSFFTALAEAIADTQAMRRAARRQYPYLSDDA